MRTEEEKIWFMEQNKFDLETYEKYEDLSNKYLEEVVCYFMTFPKQTLIELEAELQKEVYFICNESEFEKLIEKLYPNILDLFDGEKVEEKFTEYFKIDFFRERGIDKVVFVKQEKFYSRSYLIKRLDLAKEFIESLRGKNEGIYD